MFKNGAYYRVSNYACEQCEWNVFEYNDGLGTCLRCSHEYETSIDSRLYESWFEMSDRCNSDDEDLFKRNLPPRDIPDNRESLSPPKPDRSRLLISCSCENEVFGYHAPDPFICVSCGSEYEVPRVIHFRTAKYSSSILPNYLECLKSCTQIQCQQLTVVRHCNKSLPTFADWIWEKIRSSIMKDKGWTDVDMPDPKRGMTPVKLFVRPGVDRVLVAPSDNNYMTHLEAIKRKLPVFSSLSVTLLAALMAKEALLPSDLVELARTDSISYIEGGQDLNNVLIRPLRIECPFDREYLLKASLAADTHDQVEDNALKLAQMFSLPLPVYNFESLAKKFVSSIGLPPDEITHYAQKIFDSCKKHNLLLGKRNLPMIAVGASLVIAFRLTYDINGDCRLLVNLKDDTTVHLGNFCVLPLLSEQKDGSNYTLDFTFSTTKWQSKSEEEKGKILDLLVTYMESKLKVVEVVEENQPNTKLSKLQELMGRCCFMYEPPRPGTKRFTYIHYQTKDADSGHYLTHPDYFLTLLCFSSAISVEPLILHEAVLDLERELSWRDEIEINVTNHVIVRERRGAGADALSDEGSTA